MGRGSKQGEGEGEPDQKYRSSQPTGISHHAPGAACHQQDETCRSSCSNTQLLYVNTLCQCVNIQQKVSQLPVKSTWTLLVTFQQNFPPSGTKLFFVKRSVTFININKSLCVQDLFCEALIFSCAVNANRCSQNSVLIKIELWFYWFQIEVRAALKCVDLPLLKVPQY